MFGGAYFFVFIRHVEEGATSLHAGLERLGKETSEPTGTFGSHPKNILVLTSCIIRHGLFPVFLIPGQ